MGGRGGRQLLAECGAACTVTPRSRVSMVPDQEDAREVSFSRAPRERRRVHAVREPLAFLRGRAPVVPRSSVRDAMRSHSGCFSLARSLSHRGFVLRLPVVHGLGAAVVLFLVRTPRSPFRVSVAIDSREVRTITPCRASGSTWNGEEGWAPRAGCTWLKGPLLEVVHADAVKPLPALPRTVFHRGRWREPGRVLLVGLHLVDGGASRWCAESREAGLSQPAVAMRRAPPRRWRGAGRVLLVASPG